jgi:hypothetical protein
MSELEEHYLLRVPEAIADQLRAMIRDRKMPQHGVSFHLQSKFDIQQSLITVFVKVFFDVVLNLCDVRCWICHTTSKPLSPPTTSISTKYCCLVSFHLQTTL